MVIAFEQKIKLRQRQVIKANNIFVSFPTSYTIPSKNAQPWFRILNSMITSADFTGRFVIRVGWFFAVFATCLPVFIAKSVFDYRWNIWSVLFVGFSIQILPTRSEISTMAAPTRAVVFTFFQQSKSFVARTLTRRAPCSSVKEICLFTTMIINETCLRVKCLGFHVSVYKKSVKYEWKKCIYIYIVADLIYVRWRQR